MKRRLVLGGWTATVFCAAAAGALPASAAGRAHVAVSPATADPAYASTLTLSGSGFQSVKGGFGGIYALFGWVDSHWRPSAGGIAGTDYVYVQDKQTKDNNGYQKFVSFPDGGTLAQANGGAMSATGSWSTTIVVPGATFPASDGRGGVQTIDCRVVTCGIITIGAHGVVSPENETFTPVRFATPASTAPRAAAAPVSRTPSPAAHSATPTVAEGTTASPTPQAAAPTPSSTAPSVPVAPPPLQTAAAVTPRREVAGMRWWAPISGAAALLVLDGGVLVRRLRGRGRS